MRIISGIAKGHRLKTLSTNKVRPTADRVRESIFNILGPSIVDAKVLDLYAGFGAMGLEALSRGAAYVYFVEKERRVAQLIQENLDKLKFQNAKIISLDVFKALTFFARKELEFDIIFADPPYRFFENVWIHELWEKVEKILLKEGLLVIEHPCGWTSPLKYGGLEKQDSRKYGQTEIVFYKKV